MGTWGGDMTLIYVVFWKLRPKHSERMIFKPRENSTRPQHTVLNTTQTWTPRHDEAFLETHMSCPYIPQGKHSARTTAIELEWLEFSLGSFKTWDFLPKLLDFELWFLLGTRWDTREEFFGGLGVWGQGPCEVQGVRKLTSKVVMERLQLWFRQRFHRSTRIPQRADQLTGVGKGRLFRSFPCRAWQHWAEALAFSCLDTLRKVDWLLHCS